MLINTRKINVTFKDGKPIFGGEQKWIDQITGIYSELRIVPTGNTLSNTKSVASVYFTSRTADMFINYLKGINITSDKLLLENVDKPYFVNKLIIFICDSVFVK